MAVPALLQGIRPSTGLNYGGGSQLGEGFYTTPDYATALTFAVNAVVVSVGRTVVLHAYARNFERMQGEEVPEPLWWNIPDDSPYVTDFDYLTAPITGFEPVRQVKFNPRAYGSLSVR